MRVAGMLALVLLTAACATASPAPRIDERDAAVVPEEAGVPGVPAAPPPLDAGEVSWTSEYFQPGAVGQATPIPRKDAPALRYASLGRSACEAELVRRKIPFARAESTRGVRAPVRLAGPLHGVTIHSELTETKRVRSPFEIFDCRLVLALDDFTEVVAQNDVVEILHMSAFRSRKQRGCTSKFANKQHCGALAVDVGTFVKKDGTRLVVDRDFNGKIGQGTCISNAKPSPVTPEAEELWGYVCESARRALFNVVLTPNFNADHKNHFHLEVTPDAGWMLIH
ncbi:MAG TPA: extensin family protein [Labilithrix sp.]|nr:extensin family protein [Labilithrix sp.]